MKGPIIIALFFFLVACRTSKKGGEALPAFDLQLVDSITKFNTSSIPEGHPIMLFYFSPDCGHCHEETYDILAKMDSLKDVKIYFITNEPFQWLQGYNTVYHLYKYPNITLGWDFKYFFPGYFKNVAPPTVVIYDDNKRLQGIFKGKTSISQIIAFIANINS